MNDLFAPFYQFIEDFFGMYQEQFDFIFEQVYNSNGYMQMGLILVLVPLVLLTLFYYVYKNPYATIMHWGIWVLIIVLVIGGSSYGLIRLMLEDFILDPDSEIASFTQNLVIQYALINGVLSIAVSFIWSIILKQKSKIQMHLPILKP